MRKKLVILTMVTLITLVAATPALAGHGGPGGNGGGGGRPFFALVGTITATDEEEITVWVADGNRFVEPYIGGELTVQLTNSTGFFVWYPDGRRPIDFEDVEEGDTASIHGTVVDDVFTADWVIVGVPCAP
ncbi:MAG: hypothetical protein ISS56_02640 [Anaerolineae bacterium]|nr:hypothetical protein [Anaerolineae bacterium]